MPPPVLALPPRLAARLKPPPPAVTVLVAPSVALPKLKARLKEIKGPAPVDLLLR